MDNYTHIDKPADIAAFTESISRGGSQKALGTNHIGINPTVASTAADSAARKLVNVATATPRRGPHAIILGDQSPHTNNNNNNNNTPEPLQNPSFELQSRSPTNSSSLASDKHIAETMMNAKLGDKDAQVALGKMYEDGIKGMPQNYDAAMGWYMNAADQGNAAALNKVGNMYYHGRGVPPDYALASAFFRKAAEQGDVDGQRNLGHSYQYGHGVPQDYLNAMEWYLKAANHGDGDAIAQLNLAFFYDKGYGVPRDALKAMTWYLKAANQGNPLAQYEVGALYELGTAVPKDQAKAIMWYRRAAQLGYGNAKVALNRLGQE
jgi:TPR repeat protein